MDQIALSASAKSQRAEYREQDDAPNRYYVNVYFDHGEGFLRRETIRDGLTKRQAEALTNSLNRTARALARAAQEITYSPLTADQLAALHDFARKNGRCWKSELRGAWQFDGTNAELQHMRNTHGPRWLAGFKLPKATVRLHLSCRSCGRDFSEPYNRADGCPADDCPSHFEENGIRHPDFT